MPRLSEIEGFRTQTAAGAKVSRLNFQLTSVTNE
ncbi:hypothetical protein FBX97_5812 [Herbaspirillum sp. SJZ107]|nr:hypothetical protein FBX97_5812 [Herbaspirillum sp. SJZ107]